MRENLIYFLAFIFSENSVPGGGKCWRGNGGGKTRRERKRIIKKKNQTTLSKSLKRWR